jgi:hypothetical protein
MIMVIEDYICINFQSEILLTIFEGIEEYIKVLLACEYGYPFNHGTSDEIDTFVVMYFVLATRDLIISNCLS